MERRSQETPVVSFVIAAHDAEPYILEAAASVLGQSMREIELIVVDDGSRDATVSRLETLRSDPRLTIVRQTNAGCAVARNRGIELARGRYVAILDADDRCWPDRAKAQADALRADPDLGLVGTFARVIDPSGRHLGVLKPPTTTEAIREQMRGRMAFVHPSIAAPREVLRAMGGYNAAYPTSEDYELLCRILTAHRAVNLPKVLIDLRIHGNNKSFYMFEQQQLRGLLTRHVIAAGGWNAVSAELREHAKGKVTREMLVEVGVPERAIDERLASGYLDRISTSLRLGQWDRARGLSDEAMAFARGAGDEELEAQLSALRAVVFAGEGAIGTAVGELRSGLGKSPRSVLRALALEARKRAHGWWTAGWLRFDP